MCANLYALSCIWRFFLSTLSGFTLNLMKLYVKKWHHTAAGRCNITVEELLMVTSAETDSICLHFCATMCCYANLTTAASLVGLTPKFHSRSIVTLEVSILLFKKKIVSKAILFRDLSVSHMHLRQFYTFFYRHKDTTFLFFSRHFAITKRPCLFINSRS